MYVTQEQFDVFRIETSERFETLSTELKSFMMDAVDAMMKQFDRVYERFDSLETRFDTLETRFDRLETRFDTLETKVDRLDKKVGRLNQSMRAMRTDFSKRINLQSEQVKVTDRFAKQVEERVLNVEARVDFLEETR